MDTDNTPAQSPQPAETTTQQPSTPSLEEISREFSVDEQASKFQATPSVPQFQPPQQQAPQPFVPDPVVDPEGYKRAWLLNQQQLTGFQSQTQQVLSKLEAFEKAQQQQRIDADVNRVVTRVNEKLQADPDLVEAALEVEYRKNPTFKFIWDNRDRNPGAFEKAIDAITTKLGPKFQTRHDPQLTENQRAAQASQRTMSTTQKNDQFADALRMADGEFDAFWNQLKNSGV